MREAAPQREYSVRAVVNARRWLVRSGAPWRRLPHDFPPWEAVYQQRQRWLKAGVVEARVEDLRVVVRIAPGRNGHPSAASLDSRTLPSSPERGHRAG
jgi:transposase